jgi:hypothetical protein
VCSLLALSRRWISRLKNFRRFPNVQVVKDESSSMGYRIALLSRFGEGVGPAIYKVDPEVLGLAVAGTQGSLQRRTGLRATTVYDLGYRCILYSAEGSARVATIGAGRGYLRPSGYRHGGEGSIE